MSLIESRQVTKLRLKIEEAIQGRATHLVDGGASDYCAYRESIGYILGLKHSLELIEETNKEISGGS